MRRPRPRSAGVALALALVAGSAPGSPLTVPPDAAIYPGLMAPILKQRCGSCHGESKQKGQLRLDTLDGIHAGGKNGPAVTPGSAAESRLMQRMLLPLDDLDHMPPEEKTQPTETEVRLLQWWLEAGLPAMESIQSADLPGGLVQVAVDPLSPSSLPPPIVEDVDWSALQAASQLLILPISLDDPIGLQVSPAGRAAEIGDDSIRALAPVASRIAYLNLSRTQVTDAALETIGTMHYLQWLALDHTAISDAGIQALERLPRLRHLNLSATAVTDAAITILRRVPALRRVYLAGTGVSEPAARQLETHLNDREEVFRLRQDLATAQSRLQVALADVSRGLQPPAWEAPGPPSPALNATCPVSGEAVDLAFTLEHDGQSIAFCCETCRERFQADPAAFPLPATSP